MTVACIFDMDNTFALTSKADGLALSATFQSLRDDGINIDYETDVRGQDIGAVCQTLNKKFQLALDEHEVRMRFRANFNRQADHIEFTPGTFEAFTHFKDVGVVQAIASNSSLVRIGHVLSRLDKISGHNIGEGMKGGLFSALDHTPGRIKPDPDIFILAINSIVKNFSNSGFKIYLVEESRTGMNSAVAAREAFKNEDNDLISIEVIGYTGDRVALGKDAAAASRELDALGADKCFSSMVDVANYICANSCLPQISHQYEQHGNYPDPMFVREGTQMYNFPK